MIPNSVFFHLASLEVKRVNRELWVDGSLVGRLLSSYFILNLLVETVLLGIKRTLQFHFYCIWTQGYLSISPANFGTHFTV